MSATAQRRVRVLIPVGLGLNCEAETAHAFRRLGVEPELVHLTDLLTHRHPSRISDYQLLMLIGGFAYGDHVGGGFVLATRLRAHLAADLQAFLERGGLALGICNGFQTMVRLGLLPGPVDGPHDLVPRADLGPNDQLGYRDAWVRLQADSNSPCIWTRGIESIDLPARHGEGKFLVGPDAALDELEERGQLALRYVDDAGRPTEIWPHNPNGSPRGVAGVCDRSGRVFGLMPHPDAFLHPWQHPSWRQHPDPPSSRPLGLAIFEAGLRAAAELV
ncbi:MAG: phosphoribosylformylglycinamidine synthase subunit PurQ [Acidobacteriota bacterium]|nr:MAG: phosphoribosylformylglycinamidine synthase subunit PurQ [Acidobacteriota bacterium]